jgi:DNA polymerase (family 10)
MDKTAVIEHIRRIGNMYAMQDESWKSKTFLNAARVLSGASILPENIKAKCLPGVGDAVAETAQEFLATGTSQRLRELEAELPPVLGLLDVPGVGPKTAMSLYQEYNVKTVDELETLLRSGKLKNPKLLASVEFLKAKGNGRIPREKVEPLVEAMLASIRAIPGVIHAEAGGSYRRRLATVKDVDLLVCAPGLSDFVEAAIKGFATIEASGPRRLTLRASNPTIQVDVLLVEPHNWGAALCHFTGSKEHNVLLRSLANQRGLTVNEYGIWHGDTRLGGEREEDLYEILEIPFVKPENRV